MATKKEATRHIKIPAGLICDRSLSLAERVFLGMVFSFRKQGLAMSNDMIGQILGLNPSNTSRLISKLYTDGWLKITGKRSRWRRIYFASSDKVKEILLCSQQHFTLLLATLYSAPCSKQKGNKEIINKKEPPREKNFPTQEAEDPTALILQRIGYSPQQISEIQSQGFSI